MKLSRNLCWKLPELKTQIVPGETMYFKFIRILSSVMILPIVINKNNEKITFKVLSLRTLISFVIGSIPLFVSSVLVVLNYPFYKDFISVSSEILTPFDLTLCYSGIISLRKRFRSKFNIKNDINSILKQPPVGFSSDKVSIFQPVTTSNLD